MRYYQITRRMFEVEPRVSVTLVILQPSESRNTIIGSSFSGPLLSTAVGMYNQYLQRGLDCALILDVDDAQYTLHETSGMRRLRGQTAHAQNPHYIQTEFYWGAYSDGAQTIPSDPTDNHIIETRPD